MLDYFLAVSRHLRGLIRLLQGIFPAACSKLGPNLNYLLSTANLLMEQKTMEQKTTQTHSERGRGIESVRTTAGHRALCGSHGCRNTRPQRREVEEPGTTTTTKMDAVRYATR